MKASFYDQYHVDTDRDAIGYKQEGGSYEVIAQGSERGERRKSREKV
jgi:hypothetical protein